MFGFVKLIEVGGNAGKKGAEKRKMHEGEAQLAISGYYPKGLLVSANIRTPSPHTSI